MRQFLIKRLGFLGLALILSLSIISCSTTQKVKYFQDIPDSGQIKQIPKAEYTAPVIRIGDILNVQIQSIDPLSTSMVNAGNTSSGGSSSSGSGGGLSGLLSAVSGGNSPQQPVSGYTVDKEGNIELPILGKLKAEGYTTFQLKTAIDTLAVKYFKNYTVTVKLSNFKVDVTGEVLKPGQYVMSDEKVSVLDAISMAGDLTIFGKRENVLLVRENVDGSKTAYRLNLKKSNIMSSPVFYLKQNDLIYVEPRKAKSDATDASQIRYVTIAGSILSILVILATRRL